jgi:O-antigen/teichoic acid export membrane protein
MLLQQFRNVLARRHNVRAHFWQTCSNYIQQLSGLLLSILLARLLSPDDFGQIAYVGAVLALFLLPASWSLSPQIVAEIRSNPEIVSDALHYSRILFIPRSLLATVACGFLFVTKGGEQALIGLIMSVPLVGHEFLGVIRAAMEGKGEFKLNFFDSTLTAAVSAALSLPAAWLGAGVWALVIPALPLFIGQIWLFTHVSGIALRPPLQQSSRSYFGSGTKLWLAGASDVALLRADKFLLGRFSGMAPLGDYNRAFNFSPVAARALNSLLAGPTISALTRTTQSAARLKLISKSAILLGAAGMGNFVVWWFFSKPLVPWIFGEQWINAIPIFEAMAPLSLAMAAAYLPTAVAIALRAYGKVAFARIISLVGFLSATLLLHAQISAVLMAWLLQATLVAQGLLLFLMLWPRYLRQKTGQTESEIAAVDHPRATEVGSQ